jgi:hypothetical protein
VVAIIVTYNFQGVVPPINRIDEALHDACPAGLGGRGKVSLGSTNMILDAIL